MYNLSKPINYLYFGFLFGLISFLSLFSWDGSPLLFFYTLGQALLEVGTLLSLMFLFERWIPRLLPSLFLLLFLLHLTQFFLLRLMDAPLSYFFKFFFGSGFAHSIAAFQALNFNLTMILIIAISLFLVPVIGVLLYRSTEKLSQRRPFHLSLAQLSFALIALATSLCTAEWFFLPSLTPLAHSKLEKMLPFNTTFFSPSRQLLQLTSPLAPPRREPELLPSFQISSHPNLYFFVIETLRKDFVTPETAPHLTTFARENLQFPLSFANATSTQLSWFALFHADFPHHWAEMNQSWKQGSIPLRLLKNLGYKIHVYSSSNFRYYHMDQLLFGEHQQLIDQFFDYSTQLIEPCERDALALKDFEADLKSSSGKEKNLFLFFLDSTHSEYSFPKDFPAPFLPYSKQIDYLFINPKEIEPIKNRYRNAITYVDSLFGHFLALLRQENLYDSSIIAVTGDHGEEFFEEGALFHGTHLNSLQTAVPIFLKIQENTWQPLTTQITHIDLFPSLLHFLTHQSDFYPLFDGQSVFLPHRWPYRLTVLQDGPNPPSEFCLEGENGRIHLKIRDPLTLEILSSSEKFPIHEALKPLQFQKFPLREVNNAL